MRGRLTTFLAALLAFATPAMADTLHVIGAGSLTAAFTDLMSAASRPDRTPWRSPSSARRA